MQEIIQKIEEEIKRPKSRRRKKVVKLITPNLISDIESEIIKIDYYLTSKCISSSKSGIVYRPNTSDEDQPLRIRLAYLRDLRLKLLKLF